FLLISFPLLSPSLFTMNVLGLDLQNGNGQPSDPFDLSSLSAAAPKSKPKKKKAVAAPAPPPPPPPVPTATTAVKKKMKTKKKPGLLPKKLHRLRLLRSRLRLKKKLKE